MVRQQYVFINYDCLHLEKILFYPVGQKNFFTVSFILYVFFQGEAENQ